jgi:pyruvate/2-oxoglutarate dehydrogenase complex dihydrolipoamide dehydrogenase (E3) component
VLGQEMVYRPRKASKRRNVVVVGGGLAGIQAATTAAERGHDVSLYERTSVLGGQWLPATAAKPQIGTLTEDMLHRLKRSEAKVHVNATLDAGAVHALKPDAVVVATGARQYLPKIFGIEDGNIVMAWDVLDGKVQTGEEVVVIGAGLTGSDTAYYLARNGRKVSLVNQSQIMRRVERLSKLTLKEKLIWNGVYIYPHSQVESITRKGVNIINDAELTFLKADTIVIAVGVKPEKDLAASLRSADPRLEVHEVGDCFDPRSALEAIHEGFKVATEL